MLAQDIMTPKVIYARPEDLIEDVARIMVENKISGIPVIDQEDKVIGIITERDLITKAGDIKVPFYLTLFDSIIFLENPLKFNKTLKKYLAVQVKDAMTKKVYVAEADTKISEIVEVMQDEKINRVPVVSKGKLVGIITRNDILKVLVKQHG